MATSLLMLLDDITTVLDDVAVMTKVAAKKTAGVLGDDLALNAQQVSGVRADRELPVVWSVAKGSLVNKAVLVPAALLVSALAPWAVTPLLMVGGAFLCFEGAEKLAHPFLHGDEGGEKTAELRQALIDPEADFVALEKTKIRGAVRTDFIRRFGDDRREFLFAAVRDFSPRQSIGFRRQGPSRLQAFLVHPGGFFR